MAKEIPMRPTSPMNQELTRAIEDHVREQMLRQIGVGISRPFVMYTFASTVLLAWMHDINKETVKHGVDVQVNLGPVLSAAISAKEADAEKDGSLNVVIYPMNTGISLDNIEDFLTRWNAGKDGEVVMFKEINKGANESYHRKFIESKAAQYLSDNNNIIVNEPQLAITIAIYFLVSAIDYLTDKAKAGEYGTYNIGDVVEINYGIIDGEPKLVFLPGVSAKLTVKQDSVTEH